MKKTAAVFIVCILIAGLSGFSGCKTGAADGILTGVKWILEAIRYAPANIVPIEKTFSLLFQKNGAVDMEVDCNFCGGTYLTGGNNAITIYTGNCTEAYCGDDSKDTDFHAALNSASQYEIENNRLIIYFDNGSLEFTSR
ncbi:MAG: META domain-containing protein [Candidatus Aminicenantes bacterium]|nr:META domain-containing protein [Candidatus Aminicenantes bacterium]